jgi:hypothetical protein
MSAFLDWLNEEWVVKQSVSSSKIFFHMKLNLLEIKSSSFRDYLFELNFEINVNFNVFVL